MEKKNDLRTLKTKRNIQNALLKLVAKKGDLRKITVKEICTVAECGRSTFYMYYPYKEALYEEIIQRALNAVTEGFKPLITSAPGSWYSVWKEYLQNVLTALYQVKSLFSMIPPGSEAFCAFVASLTDKIISYIDRQVLHLYHIHENNKIKIYATNRIMLSGMINEVVYCLVNTDYSIEFIQHLITPLFLAYCKEIENICAGEPPKD